MFGQSAGRLTSRAGGRAGVRRGLGLLVFVAIAGLAKAAPAAAPTLDRAALRSALFGVELSGIVRDTELHWRECIDPTGHTLYTIANEHRHGRLEIRPPGLACFAYEDTAFKDWGCWRAKQTADGLEFESDGTRPGDYVFLATQIRRNVKACGAEDVPVG